MADAPTSFGSFNGHPSEADSPSARPVRCVVLHHARRPTPETLVRTFNARGVQVAIEHEPVLALAELGRILVEYRQQTARSATFHSNGAAASNQPHPSVILVIVEPREFDKIDDLTAAIARAMPVVTVSSFEGRPHPGLRLLQRGLVETPSPPQAQRDEPTTRSRSPKPGLRLTPDDRPPSPAPVTQPAPWVIDADDDSADAVDESHDESEEALISHAELAMLLGDDYGFGDGPSDEERHS